ncbi:MAG: hypothetical protein JRF33_14335 [Deltaproteobacteria bacterium]|nr:hypothetical protein [Deltaproteobacteria bacterium]
MRTESDCFRRGLPLYLLLGLLAFAWSTTAQAETFHVLQIDEEGVGGVVLSLGQAAGAGAGDRVWVYRGVEVQHPVTKKILKDRFPIGEMELKQVGKTLSVARPEKSLKGRIRVGDEVELASLVETKKQQPGDLEKTVQPKKQDAVTMAVIAAWKKTMGKEPARRVEIWKEFQSKYPDSPYRFQVAIEIKSFSSLMEKAQAEPVLEAIPADPEMVIKAKHNGARALYRGDPLEVAMVVGGIEEVQSTYLYYRKKDADTYEKIQMKRDGDAYMRAQIPKDVVVPPGVDYFVEIVDRNERVHRAVGYEGAPHEVDITEPPGTIETNQQGRSQVSLVTDYVNFKLDGGKDYYWMAEADFLYRVRTMLYSVRVGFGVLNGEGASVNDIKRGLPSDTVGFNYGYTELEFRFHEYFSMMTRLVLGLNRPPGPGDGGLAAGAELKLRIGKETGTNLVLGGAVLQDIGMLTMLELAWDAVPYFPMSGRVEVTTQPVGEDIGVRILYQIGFSGLKWFQPTLRVGLALRRIDHVGISAGLGTVFKW